MILVPMDGSKHALKALDFAISMANMYDEKLLLLNVQRLDHVSATGDVDSVFENERKAKERQGLMCLEVAGEQIEGKAAYEKKVRFGVPSIEIANEAKEVNARCIVMGSRGNGPIVSAILGSVSYGVLHLAPCPVTIVPDNEWK